MFQDVRFAIRRLASRPGFTLLTVVIVALGIGASTAVFSVVDQTVLRPAPFSHPDRLVDVLNINRATGGGGNSLTAAKTLAWRTQPSVFEHLELYAPRQFDVTGGDEPERVNGLIVSTGLLPMLGVQPRLGRGFTDEDGRPGAEPVALVSEEVWKRRLGGDAGALGSRIDLNDEAHTVVGVMPRRFRLQGDKEAVWVPYHVKAHETDTATGGFYGIGRLAPGVTQSAAQALVDALGERLETEAPLAGTWALRLTAKRVARVNDTTRNALFVLLGAVGFVLLITCANVANLFLSHAAQREREMAVRSAIGASRWRLVREMLTESVMLAAAGGGLGVGLAYWGVGALVATAPANLAFQATSPVEIDGRILAAAGFAILLTGLLFGIVPALSGSRPNLEVTLRGSAAASAGRSPHGRLPGALVAAEVAFAVVLLVGAALMARTMANLAAIEPGFEPEGLLAAEISLPTDRYPSALARHQFHEMLRERLLALPGVTSVTTASGLPPVGGGITFGRPEVEGDAGPGDPVVAPMNSVAPEYFATLKIPLVAGRAFAEGDASGQTIISRALAERLFPGGDPVGRRFRMFEKAEWQTVIGVAGDVDGRAAEERSAIAIYYPLVRPQARAPAAAPARRSYASRTFVIRAEDPSVIAPLVRNAVWNLDSRQPVDRVRLVSDVYAEASARQRFVLVLMTGFALLALALTASGVFAVLMQLVSLRTREIGVRMALGARPRDVLRMVLARGLLPAAVGTVLGLLGAFWLSGFLEALLFEVRPSDPGSFAFVAVVLVLVALLACWLPARRAMRVEPAVALRGE